MSEPLTFPTNVYKSSIQRWKNDLFHLLFPNHCICCERELTQHTLSICAFCEDELHVTYYETLQEASRLDKLFWGRVPIDTTFAMLQFKKEGAIQTLLHAIKYKGKQDVAREMGKRVGSKMALNPSKYGSIDLLIPVPLHPKKQYMRGFNQSTRIAEGIGEALGIPINEEVLKRGVFTESQTKKNRFMRWDNVSDVFHCFPSAAQGFQHLALVDDVITTGSTLEACAQKIREQMPHVRVSVISLAVAT